MKHKTATATKERTDGRIGRESQYIHASVRPSSLGLLPNIRFALFFGKIKEPAKVSTTVPFPHF